MSKEFMDKIRVEKLKRNVPLFYIFTFLSKTGFWVPILYFFLTETKGFDSVTTLFLISVAALSTSVFEIPTGVIADKVSRKVSMTIGTLIRAICMFLLVPVGGFFPILIVMIFRGVGTSFTSGAEDSILYDSLKEINKESRYKKELNKTKTYHFLQSGAAMLLSGILSSVSLALPIILSGISYLLASFVSLSMLEPRKFDSEEGPLQEGYLKHAKSSLRLIFSSKGFSRGLTLLIFATAIMEAVLLSNKNIIPPVLSELGVGAHFVAVALSFIYFMKAIGAYIASKFNNEGGELKEIYIGLGIYAISMVALVLFRNPIVATICLAVVISIDPFIISNLYKMVNDRVSSYRRATVISIQSLMTEVLETAYLPVFGLILARVNLTASVAYIIAILGVILLLLMINVRIGRISKKFSE